MIEPNASQSPPAVSFFTNCYQRDWEDLLLTPRLEEMIRQFNFDFAFRGLVINNVRNLKPVVAAAQRAVDAGILNAFFITDEISTSMLKKFKIKRSSFRKDLYDGYWYSTGPLVALYTCQTEWLLYCTCDTMLNALDSNQWILKSIKLMSKDHSIGTTSPSWDYLNLKTQNEFSQDWCVGEKFSDQIFLVRTSVFKNPIYNVYHPSADEYPVYAGNLFEARVNAYLRDQGLKRAIYFSTTYHHTKLGNSNELVNTQQFKNPLKLGFAIWLRKINRRLRWVRFYSRSIFNNE